MTDKSEIKYGLAGVLADETAVSKVMQETNSLTYRGYAVQDLCAHCSFEEVAYLLLHGDLPNAAQLQIFEQAERSQRALSEDVLQVLRLFNRNAHPMDTIRTVVSFLGVQDDTAYDLDPEVEMGKAMRLLAQIPTGVAADFRLRRGLAPITPNAELTFAQNFFHMCFGEVPDAAVVKCFDISLILYAEHSFNASTFAARVVTSTTSDMHSAITGAIGALKGPLHGGANEAVMHMMLEIDSMTGGNPDLAARSQQWMLDGLRDKRKIMGFGHRVYRNGDSRVPTMRDAFFKMAGIKGGEKWIQIYEALEATMVEQKGIYPNLDFPTGPAYYLMGFDIPIFTPIFVMSRITGWAAHVLEQRANNRLIRPLSAYNGVDQRSVVAIGERFAQTALA